MISYPEEAIARSLLRELESTVRSGRTTLEGAGVHWQCVAQSGPRRSETACFSTFGAEYLTQFRDAGDTAAWGRTRSSTETVKAAARWVSGASLEQVFREFAFIEANRRALERLLSAAMLSNPQLDIGTTSRLERQMCDLHSLTVSGRDRFARVTFHGDNENPDVYFLWDGCAVARARVVQSRFGDLLERWLLNREPPSRLATWHEYVEVLPVARFYEEGRGIEGEFIVSWDNLEAFYRETRSTQMPFALQFIASLRRLGFDKSLRAGQSLWRMIVSRSRRHGLAGDQVFVMLDFQPDCVKLSGRLADRTIEEVSCHAPEALEEVISLLKELERCPIDGQRAAHAG